MPPVGDRERVADLRALTRLDPSAVGESAQIRRGTPRVWARLPGLGTGLRRGGLLRFKKPDEASASFAAALAYANVPFQAVRLAMVGKAEAMLLKNDRDGAVATYRELLRRDTEPRRFRRPARPGRNCLPRP